MPAEAVEITGTFTADTDTKYTVEHYTEKLDGTYELNQKQENLTGTTDTKATASPVEIEGFTYDENNSSNVKEGIIAGDGSLVLKLYYTRNSYKVTYSYTNDPVPNGASSLPREASHKYEEVVTVAEDATAPGYTFGGWSKTGTFTMPAEAVEITGTFEEEEYKITYNLEGGSVNGTNRDKYTISTDTFTLINPTQAGKVFKGWTGTGLTEETKTVTIEKGSTGDREYTAVWRDQASDLSITTNVTGNKPAEYGDELEIVVTITNNGDDSGSVTLSDPGLAQSLIDYPGVFEVESSTITMNGETTNVEGDLLINGYTIDNVASGETITVTLKIKIDGNAGTSVTTGFKADPEYGDASTATAETIKVETTVKFVKKTEKPVGTNIIVLLDQSASMGWNFDDDTTKHRHTFGYGLGASTYNETCAWYGDHSYNGSTMIYSVPECKLNGLVNAKAAAQTFLSTIFTETSNSNGSVVAAYRFGSTPRTGNPSYTVYSNVIGSPATDYNSMQALKTAIGNIESYPQNSGTPYYKAFQSAYEALYGADGNSGLAQNGNKNVIIFLTDGAPDRTDNETLRNEVLTNLNSNGKTTVIYSIAYNISETDDAYALLKSISENSGEANHRGQAFSTGIDGLNSVFSAISSDIQDHKSSKQSISGVAEMGSDVIPDKPIVINVTPIDGDPYTLTYSNLEAAMDAEYIVEVDGEYDVDATKFTAGSKIEVVFYGEDEETNSKALLKYVRSKSSFVTIENAEDSQELAKGIEVLDEQKQEETEEVVIPNEVEEIVEETIKTTEEKETIEENVNTEESNGNIEETDEEMISSESQEKVDTLLENSEPTEEKKEEVTNEVEQPKVEETEEKEEPVVDTDSTEKVVETTNEVEQPKVEEPLQTEVIEEVMPQQESLEE